MDYGLNKYSLCLLLWGRTCKNIKKNSSSRVKLTLNINVLPDIRVYWVQVETVIHLSSNLKLQEKVKK